jgi:hypothetical protein
MQMVDELVIPSCIPPAPVEEIEGMTKEQDEHNKRTFRLALASLIVSGLLAGGNLAYQIIRDHSSKASLEARFVKIETALRILTGAAAPQLEKAVDDSLRSALAEPTKAKPNAEFAGQVIRQMGDANITMSNATIKNASEHLESLIENKADIAEVWTTAGQFLTYRSEMLSGWAQTALPSCSKQLPVGLATNKASVPTSDGRYTVEVTHGPMVYRNCKIILDSPEATATLSQYLNLGDLVFKQCAIFYHGGPIVFVPVRVATQTVTAPTGKLIFTDCLFNFSLPRVPPIEGQKLVTTVLISPSGNGEFAIPPA